MQWFLDLSRLFPLKSMLIFGFGATLIVALAEKYLASEGFGSANRVTLARGAMTALLLALIGESSTSAGAWFAVILASLVVAMDGVDGWLARSRGDTSEFGARFDMEIDALLIFGAAALAWQYGKAGPWILAAGLMRYVFVASSYLLPWMRRTLPRSRRRQTICVRGGTIVDRLPRATAPAADQRCCRIGRARTTEQFVCDRCRLACTRFGPAIAGIVSDSTASTASGR